MTTPRSKLVDADCPLFYHLVSRCVRRSWLCGRDPLTKKSYSHRRRWLEDRIRQLGSAFALDIYAYAIMQNHFHLVVYYDPNAASTWTNEEVVDRWLIASPPKDRTDIVAIKQALLRDAARISQLRAQLGSLSMFMKLLKQPISRRANIEDECTGHFFEQRFYSGALLDEEAVLAAMAYVDLNPVRAKIADSIDKLEFVSATRRIEVCNNRAQELKALIKPVISGLEQAAKRLSATNGSYIEGLRERCVSFRHQGYQQARWFHHWSLLANRQRAYGSIERLKQWVSSRSLQLREIAF